MYILCLCVSLYICVFLCVPVCLCICMFMYFSVCLCFSMCVCVSLCVCVHVSVCVFMCTCLCLFMCLYASLCMSLCFSLCVSLYVYVYVSVYMYISVCVSVCKGLGAPPGPGGASIWISWQLGGLCLGSSQPCLFLFFIFSFYFAQTHTKASRKFIQTNSSVLPPFSCVLEPKTSAHLLTRRSSWKLGGPHFSASPPHPTSFSLLGFSQTRSISFLPLLSLSLTLYSSFSLFLPLSFPLPLSSSLTLPLSLSLLLSPHLPLMPLALVRLPQMSRRTLCSLTIDLSGIYILIYAHVYIHMHASTCTHMPVHPDRQCCVHKYPYMCTMHTHALANNSMYP